MIGRGSVPNRGNPVAEILQSSGLVSPDWLCTTKSTHSTGDVNQCRHRYRVCLAHTCCVSHLPARVVSRQLLQECVQPRVRAAVIAIVRRLVIIVASAAVSGLGLTHTRREQLTGRTATWTPDARNRQCVEYRHIYVGETPTNASKSVYPLYAILVSGGES